MLKLYNKMVSSLSLLIAFGLSTSVQAAPPQLNDFSHKATLSKAQTSLRQLNLPVEVYKRMYRQDYGDLRIFSADGQVVPHQINRRESRRSKQVANLTYYPFNEEQAANAGNISIEINQTTGQQQLKINQSLNKQDKLSREYQYIIENKHTDQKLCKLKLYWEQDKTSLILGLKLESSSNLLNWRTISRKINVSRLKYDNSQLVRDEVDVNCTTQKYLRLTWLNNNLSDASVKLTSIQGFYSKQNAPETQWQSFGKPKYDTEGNWLFESNVVSPLTKMTFLAPQNGLLYKGKLYSRNNSEAQWRMRHNVTQYRLHLGDSELQSNPFSLSEINDRYWKFEPTIESQFTQAQLPEIKAAWRSNKVLFIAQGNPPFRLAFGNPNIQPAKNSDLNSLIQSLQQSGSTVDSVKLTKIFINEKSFSNKSKTNWKKVILWIVLLIGTFLMALMAYRLYSQMKTEETIDRKNVDSK